MDRHEQADRLRHTGTRTGMVPISEIIPDVMSEIIQRARAAGHPPPSFVTQVYEGPHDAPEPEPPASSNH